MDAKLALTCVLIVGGAVGLALPVFHAEERLKQVAASTEGPKLTIGAVQATRASGWGDELVLARERDGHFYASVTVDGVPARMLVDTGASVVALTGDDARAMGLYWADNEVLPVAQGASGAVYGVHTVLPRMQVGDFAANNVPAIIIPEGLDVSLLGQSFLGTINTVSIVNDRMVLGS